MSEKDKELDSEIPTTIRSVVYPPQKKRRQPTINSRSSSLPQIRDTRAARLVSQKIMNPVKEMASSATLGGSDIHISGAIRRDRSFKEVDGQSSAVSANHCHSQPTDQETSPETPFARMKHYNVLIDKTSQLSDTTPARPFTGSRTAEANSGLIDKRVKKDNGERSKMDQIIHDELDTAKNVTTEDLPEDVHEIELIYRIWSAQFQAFCAAAEEYSPRKDTAFQMFVKELEDGAKQHPEYIRLFLKEVIIRMTETFKRGLPPDLLFSYNEEIRVNMDKNDQITSVEVLNCYRDRAGENASSSSENPLVPILSPRSANATEIEMQDNFENIPGAPNNLRLEAFLRFKKELLKTSPGDSRRSDILRLRSYFRKMEQAVRADLPLPESEIEFEILTREFESLFPSRAIKLELKAPEADIKGSIEIGASNPKKDWNKRKTSQHPFTSDGKPAAASTSKSAAPSSTINADQFAKGLQTFKEAYGRIYTQFIEIGSKTPSLDAFLMYKDAFLARSKNCSEAEKKRREKNMAELEHALRNGLPPPDLHWGADATAFLAHSVMDSLTTESVIRTKESEPASVRETEVPKKKAKKRKSKKKGHDALAENQTLAITDLPASPTRDLSSCMIMTGNGAGAHDKCSHAAGQHSQCTHETWWDYDTVFTGTLADTIANLVLEWPFPTDLRVELHDTMQRIKNRMCEVDATSAYSRAIQAEATLSTAKPPNKKVAALKKGGMRKSAASKPKASAQQACQSCALPIRPTAMPVNSPPATASTEAKPPLEVDSLFVVTPEGPLTLFGRLDTPDLKRAAAIYILSSPLYYNAFNDCTDHLNYLLDCRELNADIILVEVEALWVVVKEIHLELSKKAKAKLKLQVDEQEGKNAPLTQKEIHDQKLGESMRKMKELEEKEKSMKLAKSSAQSSPTAPLSTPSTKQAPLTESEFQRTLDYLNNSSTVEDVWIVARNYVTSHELIPEGRQLAAIRFVSDPSKLANFVAMRIHIEKLSKANDTEELRKISKEAGLIWEAILVEQDKRIEKFKGINSDNKPPTSSPSPDMKDFVKNVMWPFVEAFAKVPADDHKLALTLEFIVKHPYFKASTKAAATSVMSSHLQLDELLVLYKEERKNTKAVAPIEVGGQSESITKVHWVQFKNNVTFIKKILEERVLENATQHGAIDNCTILPATTKPVTPDAPETPGLTYSLQDYESAYAAASTEEERHAVNYAFVLPLLDCPKFFRGMAISLFDRPEEMATFTQQKKRMEDVPEKFCNSDYTRQSLVNSALLVELCVKELQDFSKRRSQTGHCKASIASTNSPKPITSRSFADYKAAFSGASTDTERRAVNDRFIIPGGSSPMEIRKAARIVYEDPAEKARLLEHKKRMEDLPIGSPNAELLQPLLNRTSMVQEALKDLEVASMAAGLSIFGKQAVANTIPAPATQTPLLTAYENAYFNASTDKGRAAVNSKIPLPPSCYPEFIRALATAMVVDRSKVSKFMEHKKFLQDRVQQTGTHVQLARQELNKTLMVEEAFKEATTLPSYNIDYLKMVAAGIPGTSKKGTPQYLYIYEEAYFAASSEEEEEDVNSEFGLPSGCHPEDFKELASSLMTDDWQLSISLAGLSSACHPEDPKELASSVMTDDLQVSALLASMKQFEQLVQSGSVAEDDQQLLNKSLMVQAAYKALMDYHGVPGILHVDGKPHMDNPTRTYIAKFLSKGPFTEKDINSQAADNIMNHDSMFLFKVNKNYMGTWAPHYGPAKEMLDVYRRVKAAMELMRANIAVNDGPTAKQKQRTNQTPASRAPTAAEEELTPAQKLMKKEFMAANFKLTQKFPLAGWEVRSKARDILAHADMFSSFLKSKKSMEYCNGPEDSKEEKFFLNEIKRISAEMERMLVEKAMKGGSSRVATNPLAPLTTSVTSTTSSKGGVTQNEIKRISAEMEKVLAEQATNPGSSRVATNQLAPLTTTVPSATSSKGNVIPKAIGRKHGKAVLAEMARTVAAEVLPPSFSKLVSDPKADDMSLQMSSCTSRPSITITPAPNASIPINRVIAYLHPSLQISPDPTFQPKTPRLPVDIEYARKYIVSGTVAEQRKSLAELYAKSPNDYAAFLVVKKNIEDAVKERPEDATSIEDEFQPQKMLVMLNETDSMVRQLRMGSVGLSMSKEKVLVGMAAAEVLADFDKRKMGRLTMETLKEVFEDEVDADALSDTEPSEKLEDAVDLNDYGNFVSEVFEAGKNAQKVQKTAATKWMGVPDIRENNRPALPARIIDDFSVPFLGVAAEDQRNQSNIPPFTDPVHVVRFAMGKDPFKSESAPASDPTSAHGKNEKVALLSEDEVNDVVDESHKTTIPSSIDTIPSVAQAVQDKIPVFTDPAAAMSYVQNQLGGKVVEAAEPIAIDGISALKPRLLGKLQTQDQYEKFLAAKNPFADDSSPEHEVLGEALNDIQRTTIQGEIPSESQMEALETTSKNLKASRARGPGKYARTRIIKTKFTEDIGLDTTEPIAPTNKGPSTKYRMSDLKARAEVNPHMALDGSPIPFPVPPRKMSFSPISGFPLPPPAPETVKESLDLKDKEPDALKMVLRLAVTAEPLFAELTGVQEVRQYINSLFSTYSRAEIVARYASVFDASKGTLRDAEFFMALEEIVVMYGTIGEMKRERINELLTRARENQMQLAWALEDAAVRNERLEKMAERIGFGDLVECQVLVKALGKGRLYKLHGKVAGWKATVDERAEWPTATKRAEWRARVLEMKWKMEVGLAVQELEEDGEAKGKGKAISRAYGRIGESLEELRCEKAD